MHIYLLPNAPDSASLVTFRLTCKRNTKLPYKLYIKCVFLIYYISRCFLVGYAQKKKKTIFDYYVCGKMVTFTLLILRNICLISPRFPLSFIFMARCIVFSSIFKILRMDVLAEFLPPGKWIDNSHVLTKLKFAVRQLSDLPVYMKRKASFLRSDTEFQQLHQELCSDTVYHKRIKNCLVRLLLCFPA